MLIVRYLLNRDERMPPTGPFGERGLVDAVDFLVGVSGITSAKG